MRTVMRPRHYCDHCKKASGSAYHMRRHEAGCTMNPNRKCGFCGATGEKLAELIAIINAEGFKAMHSAAECPGCTLAALRQTATHVYPDDGRNEWSFTQERDEWWHEANETMQYDTGCY